MSAYLIEQIAGIPSIAVRTCTTMTGAQGDGHLEAITVEDRRTGERETLPASHLFVFIGGAPRPRRRGGGGGPGARGRERKPPKTRPPQISFALSFFLKKKK